MQARQQAGHLQPDALQPNPLQPNCNAVSFQWIQWSSGSNGVVDRSQRLTRRILFVYFRTHNGKVTRSSSSHRSTVQVKKYVFRNITIFLLNLTHN
jgi:hypothetical protein